MTQDCANHFAVCDCGELAPQRRDHYQSSASRVEIRPDAADRTAEDALGSREEKSAMSISFRMPALATVVAAFASVPAGAQTPEEFFKGKTVEMVIGYTPGGGYDVYGRLVARFIGKHIPGNPSVVPKNSPGAGSLIAANWLYSVAPKDGTALATVARGAAFDPLLGNTAAKFDGNKFNWIGSANDEVSVCVSWKTSGITKFEDLYTKELLVGGTGPSADTDQFPKVMNAVLGTKLKLIPGYPGGNEVNLAMERGEVTGRCAWSWSSVIATRANWYKDKTIHVLIQLSLAKHPDLPDVPLITDLAKNEEQKQIFELVFARQTMGRPFMAPPGVPNDRVAALRTAFMATMKDPEFLAEAQRGKLEITPVSGEELQKIVERVYKTNPAIAKKVADMLN
jgi:tripartite-type tricarboxylate transporter receptor subunit TctC